MVIICIHSIIQFLYQLTAFETPNTAVAFMVSVRVCDAVCTVTAAFHTKFIGSPLCLSTRLASKSSKTTRISPTTSIPSTPATEALTRTRAARSYMRTYTISFLWIYIFMVRNISLRHPAAVFEYRFESRRLIAVCYHSESLLLTHSPQASGPLPPSRSGNDCWAGGAGNCKRRSKPSADWKREESEIEER